MSSPTLNDLERFFDHLDEERKLPIMLIYGSGLRAFEIQSLKIGDVNFYDSILNVNGRATVLADCLKPHLEKLMNGRAPSDQLFGKKYSDRSLKRYIEYAARASGVQMTSTVLRQAFVKHSLQLGSNWERVRDAVPYTPNSFRTLFPLAAYRHTLQGNNLNSPLADYGTNLRPKTIKGIIFDTNRSYDSPPDYCESLEKMVKFDRLAAWGDRKEVVRYLAQGDIVFYSHKGFGLVGAAKIIGDSVLADGPEELYWDVQFLTKKPLDCRNPSAISVKEVKRITGKNFFWHRIIKVPYLSRGEAHVLLENIQKIIGYL